MERVQKILSNNGFCSRRKAEKLIEEGRVRVNGTTITIGDKAYCEDKITVDDKEIRKADQVYIVFNKPVKCVTALKDAKYKTVMDYINVNERVYPVGRLDYNTSGLLILTNDGGLANRIAHPSHGSTKVYKITLQQKLQEKDMEKIKEGVRLDDGVVKAGVTQLDEHTAEIMLHEGRNRVIRRLFRTLGYNISSLHRKAIGRLTLGSLRQGEYKIVPRHVVEKAVTN